MWPLRVSGSCSLVASNTQTLMVPSTLLEASRRPSGLKATLQRMPVWPVKARISCWVERSQTLTVPSQLHEASRRPSGLKATSVAPPAASSAPPVAAR